VTICRPRKKKGSIRAGEKKKDKVSRDIRRSREESVSSRERRGGKISRDHSPREEGIKEKEKECSSDSDL